MNTIYTCLIYILLRLWKCENIFVKKYSTVEITCPFIEIGNVSVNWNFEQSKIISIGKDVNPKFGSKYSVIRNGNLQIRNFSYADEGQYACQGFIGKKVHDDTVIVKVCNVPKDTSSISSVFEENSEGISNQTNVLCTHDVIVESGKMFNDEKGKYLLRATLKLHISPECNLDKDRGKHNNATTWKYTCLTLNGDQCVTSNVTFLVTVEWISKEERSFTEKSTGFLKKQLDVYTGDCVSFNTKTNSNCEDTIKIYLTNDMNKVLYLKNVNKTTTETFLCNINKVDNLEEITTVIHADIDCKQLTYTFGVIAAVLIVLLIVAVAVIKTMALKINRIARTDSLPIPTKRKESIEDEHTHDKDVVPDNVATTDSVNLQSIDLGKSASNPTLSGNASSYYQFDVSENSHTEAINEQKTERVNNSDNIFNNCFENDIYSAGDLYVNTSVMNTYEQLDKNNTTDIQTYEDFSYDH